MERTTHRRRTPAGFTLVEILVVICVITILIGLTASATFSARQKAYTAAAHQDCEQIVAAFKSYWLAHGEWPASAKTAVTDDPDKWTDLTKDLMKDILGGDKDGLVYLALDEKQFEDDGTYVDPWGNPYQIKIDPKTEVELEDKFVSVVSFPNQFFLYYDVDAPYVE